ncbi:hypothetical protein NKH77_06040 [Streptomyces sp. M19]
MRTSSSRVRSRSAGGSAARALSAARSRARSRRRRAGSRPHDAAEQRRDAVGPGTDGGGVHLDGDDAGSRADGGVEQGEERSALSPGSP